MRHVRLPSRVGSAPGARGAIGFTRSSQRLIRKTGNGDGDAARAGLESLWNYLHTSAPHLSLTVVEMRAEVMRAAVPAGLLVARPSGEPMERLVLPSRSLGLPSPRSGPRSEPPLPPPPRRPAPHHPAGLRRRPPRPRGPASGKVRCPFHPTAPQPSRLPDAAGLVPVRLSPRRHDLRPRRRCGHGHAWPGRSALRRRLGQVLAIPKPATCLDAGRERAEPAPPRRGAHVWREPHGRRAGRNRGARAARRRLVPIGSGVMHDVTQALRLVLARAVVLAALSGACLPARETATDTGRDVMKAAVLRAPDADARIR